MTWEPLSMIIILLHLCKEKSTQATQNSKKTHQNSQGIQYRQAKATKRYIHGWEVPRDYADALQLDVQNFNTKWKDAIDLEIEQSKENQVFNDHGKVVYEKGKIINAPKDHQKIRVHFMFDVKHC